VAKVKPGRLDQLDLLAQQAQLDHKVLQAQLDLLAQQAQLDHKGQLVLKAQQEITVLMAQQAQQAQLDHKVLQAQLDGATGATGATGQGVPVGGTSGQVLSKINSTNYNTQWVTPSTGVTSIGGLTGALNSTGTGDVVFGDSPTFTGTVNAPTIVGDLIGNATTSTTAATATVAITAQKATDDLSGIVIRGAARGSGTTTAGSNLTVTHSLGTTPGAVIVSARSDTYSSSLNTNIFVGAITSTTFTVFANNGAGGTVAAAFRWIAMR